MFRWPVKFHFDGANPRARNGRGYFLRSCRRIELTSHELSRQARRPQRPRLGPDRCPLAPSWSVADLDLSPLPNRNSRREGGGVSPPRTGVERERGRLAEERKRAAALDGV